MIHSMKATHTRSTGKRLTYEISTDRFGSYTISLAGKPLRTVSAPSHFLGRKRWGTKEQELAALVLAQADIENLRGFSEEG